METTNLADLYNLDAIPWSRALEALEGPQPPMLTWFLATTRPDGRPHIAGVGAIWYDDKVWFTQRPRDPQEPEPHREPQLRDRGVAARDRPRLRRRAAAGDRRRDAQTAREALRRDRLAGEGRGRRVHVRLQRAERRTAAVVPALACPDDRLRVLGSEPGGATRWRFTD